MNTLLDLINTSKSFFIMITIIRIDFPVFFDRTWTKMSVIDGRLEIPHLSSFVYCIKHAIRKLQRKNFEL